MDGSRSVQHGQAASLGARFGGAVLDYVLLSLTFYVGWLVWLAFVARRGATPGKQMTELVIHNARTGQVASAGRVWLRDVVLKLFPPFAVSVLLASVVLGSREAAGAGVGLIFYIPTFFLYYLAAALLVAVTKDRRAPWDYLAGTMVCPRTTGATQPTAVSTSERMQGLETLWRRGLINESEYEAKRKEILAQL